MANNVLTLPEAMFRVVREQFRVTFKMHDHKTGVMKAVTVSLSDGNCWAMAWKTRELGGWQQDQAGNYHGAFPYWSGEQGGYQPVFHVVVSRDHARMIAERGALYAKRQAAKKAAMAVRANQAKHGVVQPRMAFGK